MKKTALLLLLALASALSPFTANGQQATITNTSINYNDQNYLVYSFNMSVKGANGHVIQPYLYIHLDNGEFLKDDGEYVCFAGSEDTSDYDNCEWKNKLSIIVRLTNLCPLEGKHIYKARVYVKDKTTGEFMTTECDFRRYTLSSTPVGDNGCYGHYISDFANPDAKSTPRRNPHGSADDHGTMVCANCSGTGREPCIVCWGRGKTWSNAYKCDVTCSNCGGSGRKSCQVCHGTGERYY